MKEIYKLKEELLELYRSMGLPLVIASRIMIALISVVLINLNVGAMEQLKGMTVVLGVSVIAGVLPISLGTVVLLCFTLGHVFAVSLVAGALVAAILIVMFMFGKLFSPKETYLFVASFIICLMGGIYAVPLVLAMVGSALGVVPILGGVTWYIMISLVADIKNLLTDGGVTDAVFTVLDSLLENQIIPLTLIVIAIAYIVATLVRNTSINESWKVGLASAGVINIIFMAVGGLFTSASVPLGTLLVQTFVGFVIGLIVEIFVHNVDYRGMEQLKFEDDEYFYFVKAIPKKDAPRPLVIEEPTKAELKEEAKAARKNVPNKKVVGTEQPVSEKRRTSTAKPVGRSKKETPQEKRARERAAYK